MSSSNGKRPWEVQLDERGDRLARNGVALVDAHDAAAQDDRGEDVHRDVGVRRGRADDPAHAPRGEDVDGLAEHGRDAGRLQRAVDAAAAGDLRQCIDRIVLARVDDVGAPSRVASSSLAGLTSTTATVAPVRWTAAMRALRPTPPAPKTASVEPGSGRRTVSTDCAPVCTPHASGPRISSGAFLATLTTLLAGARARVASEDCPKKWPWSASPLRWIVGLPSARSPPKDSGRPSSRSTPAGRCGTSGTARRRRRT